MVATCSVPLRLEYIDFCLRNPAAMLVHLFAVLGDIELLDECRSVLDEHRQNRLRGLSAGAYADDSSVPQSKKLSGR